jgi:hypothetical protein
MDLDLALGTGKRSGVAGRLHQIGLSLVVNHQVARHCPRLAPAEDVIE